MEAVLTSVGGGAPGCVAGLDRKHSYSRPAPRHVLRRKLPLKHAIRRSQKIFGVGAVRLDGRRVSLKVRVGCPQQSAIVPGHDQEHAMLGQDGG